PPHAPGSNHGLTLMGRFVINDMLERHALPCIQVISAERCPSTKKSILCLIESTCLLSRGQSTKKNRLYITFGSSASCLPKLVTEPARDRNWISFLLISKNRIL